MKTFDVITIGNAVVDLFLVIHDANASMRVDKELNELCVKAGEKIEVDRCDVMLGGNAANAAVGLARNGFIVGLAAEIGDDEFAQKIEHILQQETVDTTLLKKTENAASSMTVGINFQNERTLFVEHVKREHHFNFDNFDTKWVYLTSLGNEWKVPYERVVRYVKKTGARLAFNPGTLQVQARYEEIKNAMQTADILFLNKEEGAKIFNFQFSIFNENGKEAIKNLLKKLQQAGPKVVVITDGENGSYAIDEEGKIWFLDVFPATVVEKTGAGDAFASGFMSAILAGESVQQAMCWGAANSAAVIERIGAQQGLLSREKIEEKLKKADYLARYCQTG
ncbi:MAG: carbohydrate kinase family protein [Candidatus Levyibacteriota bacterium]|nr:MAG: carbohydrate kinase family protein [Candidatus Levybacteria bacterium]